VTLFLSLDPFFVVQENNLAFIAHGESFQQLDGADDKRE
jgi:hypothetical protein